MQIEIKGIRKRYGRKFVLNGIDLSASSGTCVGILGGNGCGKSTLLSILAGVQKCDGGQFFADGKDLLRDRKLRSRTVGYVPQGTPLIDELSAWDNLMLWYGREDAEKSLRDGVLQLLGVSEFLKVPVCKMSGGMKKRLSIGCAMAKHPPVLLLDEPSSALDLDCKARIAAYLKQYKKEGGILLLTTHDVPELSLCDRWYVMRQGVLVPYDYDGDVDRLVKSL